MSDKTGSRFDASHLRLMWQRAERAASVVATPFAKTSSPTTSAQDPAASSDPAEQLQRESLQLHIPLRPPQEVIRELGELLRSRLGDDRLAVLNLWKSLCEQVAAECIAKETAAAPDQKRAAEVASLIDRLDDALASLLSRRQAEGDR